MEANEGTPKIVVFGVGGAGCKTLNQLSRQKLEEVALVGVDIDRGQINSLQPPIRRVLVGGSLDERSLGSFDSAKDTIKRDLGPMDEILEGASVAVIVAGLGRKTGTFTSSIIAEKIASLGIPCIALLIYPFVTNGGGGSEAREALKRLRENVNGVVIVDNNMKRKHEKAPILDIFRLINSYIVTFIDLLDKSIAGSGSMNLSAGELKYFFQRDHLYIMAVGHGGDVKESLERALAELGQYVNPAAVRKLLVAVSSMFEVGIGEMKEAGDVLQEKTSAEELRWMVSSNDEKRTRMILIAGAKELPMLKEAAITKDVPAIEEEKPYEIEEESLEKFDTDNSTPPALVGLDLLQTPEQDSPSKKSPPKEKKKEPDERSKKEEKKKVAGLEGIGGRRREVKDESEEELEDLASELTGFPTYKTDKKGQKKLSEYKDDYGIDYI